MPYARLFAAAALTLIATALQAEPRRFEIDTDHFSVGFLVEHAGYDKTLGLFREARGTFVYDEAKKILHSGKVVVQADSVDTNHAERDEHLRGGDFLAAGSHPAIRFEATDLELGDDNQGTLTGDLSLLGTTREIELDITVNKTGPYPFGDNAYVLGASARGSIERSDFGMTYGVDGGLVGDEVELILEFEAVRQPK